MMGGQEFGVGTFALYPDPTNAVSLPGTVDAGGARLSGGQGSSGNDARWIHRVRHRSAAASGSDMQHRGDGLEVRLASHRKLLQLLWHRVR